MKKTAKNLLSTIIAILVISACFSAVYALEEFLTYGQGSSLRNTLSASPDEATPEEATLDETTPDETAPVTEEATFESNTAEPSSYPIIPTDNPTEAQTEQSTLPAETESTEPETNTSEPITSPQTLPEDTEPSETVTPIIPTETEFIVPTTEPTEPTETEFIVPTTEPTEPTETEFIVPTTEPTEPTETVFIIPTAEPTEPTETEFIIPTIEPTQPIIVPTVPTAPTVKPTKPVPKTSTAVWNERGNRICGYRQKDGSILFKTSSNVSATSNDLHYLLSGNKKKTIVLPKKKITIIRVLEIGSNTTIIANGATVYQKNKKKPIILNRCSKVNYSAVKNIKIIGGKWYINGNATNKHRTSTFRFAHAGNITLKKCSIDTNYICHAVELIACKNVTIDKCKLLAKGKTVSNSLEEALQIDIATRKTTGKAFEKMPKKYVNGQTCKNITVKNCTIRGSRGVCANRTESENNKWLKKHHSNIKLINNTITGMTSEAVALHNAAGLTVKKNKIYSKGKRTGSTYSIGLNIASFGKTNLISKKKVTIIGNTIKGGRQAIQVVTYKNTKSGAYGSHNFGTVIIKKNKLYCKHGKGNCILTKRCKRVKKSGNKNHGW